MRVLRALMVRRQDKRLRLCGLFESRRSMRIGFKIWPLALLMSFPVLTALAQDSQFTMKLSSRVSFQNQTMGRIYNRESDIRGNMAVSPDGRYFLGRLNKSTISLLDLDTRQTRTILLSHDAAYGMFTKNGRRVLVFDDSANRRNITVLNLELGKVVSVIKSSEGINEVSQSYDDERIATSRDETKIVLKEKNFVNI